MAGDDEPRPAAHAVRAREPHLRAHLLLLDHTFGLYRGQGQFTPLLAPVLPGSTTLFYLFTEVTMPRYLYPLDLNVANSQEFHQYYT